MDGILYKIGLGLAVALLICLFPMPYGYYTLVRFVAMIYFGCMAFSLYQGKNQVLRVLAISLVILFQPFFKLAIGRTMWNIVDVIVAIGLILLWYNRKRLQE